MNLDPLGEECDATLTHLHGEGECRLPKGHEGEHEAVCWTCAEWSHPEDELLTWEQQHEDWTR